MAIENIPDSAGHIIGEGEVRKHLPLWRRILLVLVLAAMVMVAGLLLVTYLAERQVGAEVVKISRAGEPVKFTIFSPGKLMRRQVKTQPAATSMRSGKSTQATSMSWPRLILFIV